MLLNCNLNTFLKHQLSVLVSQEIQHVITSTVTKIITLKSLLFMFFILINEKTAYISWYLFKILLHILHET